MKVKKLLNSLFKITKNDQGVTIMEVVVAAGIMSVGFLAYMTYNKMLSNAEKETADTISSTRLLNSVINDLKADNRFMLPANVAYDEALFDDPSISGERCYDRQGGRIFFPDFTTETDPEQAKTVYVEEQCFYYTKFFKLRVSHLNSDTKANIPLSQLHVKIRYFQGVSTSKREINTILSPFVANTAQY